MTSEASSKTAGSKAKMTEAEREIRIRELDESIALKEALAKEQGPPPHEVCPKCGYDHNYPQSETAAMRILACVMPDENFISKHEEQNPKGNRSFYVTGDALV